MSTFPPGYRIRAARIRDLATLADIERAASKLFRDTPYSFLVDSEPLPLDFVKQQFHEGQVWVSVDERDSPVGYAVVQEVDEKVYLQQIDVYPVYPSHGRRGIGRKLVQTVCVWAKHHNYHGSVLDLWKHSNSTTKLIAIDEQSDHNAMQPDRFGETNRFAG